MEFLILLLLCAFIVRQSPVFFGLFFAGAFVLAFVILGIRSLSDFSWEKVWISILGTFCAWVFMLAVDKVRAVKRLPAKETAKAEESTPPPLPL